jgi:hypothetical protein
MQSPQRIDRDVVVHWPSGPTLERPSGPRLGINQAPVGDLRSYLRELALGRR